MERDEKTGHSLEFSSAVRRIEVRLNLFIFFDHIAYQNQQVFLAILERNTLYVKTALSNLEGRGKTKYVRNAC